MRSLQRSIRWLRLEDIGQITKFTCVMLRCSVSSSPASPGLGMGFLPNVSQT